MENQFYCVAATAKTTGTRADITGPITKERAASSVRNWSSKHFIYPKVSKWPYKTQKRNPR